jgi:glycolate oxidase FAD binding subunit
MPSATLTQVERVTPTEQVGVGDVVREAFEAGRPLFLVGGGTSQDFGAASDRAGQTLDLTGLNRIVDYTPRDMTIVVEAGVRLAELASTLAAEGQHLPIDVPRASEATIGGVVATNWSGPRRYGYGTVRDYVIGVNAVDGRGIAFKGGGRVVKNVAGYDFCKLLTGSLGTLGVITQLAFKVKPRPECSTTVVGDCADLAIADRALERLANLDAPPVAVDLLTGAGWNLVDGGERGKSAPNHIVVHLEGSEAEIGWLSQQVQSALAEVGATAVRELSKADSAAVLARQVEFSDRGAGADDEGSPMVVKIAVPPSAVSSMFRDLQAADAKCTIQAHAGNGIIIARFAAFTQADSTKTIVGKLRPAAVLSGGSLVIVKSTMDGLTPHLVWGGRTDATVLLERIKRQFDPRNILNPGRFAYD